MEISIPLNDLNLELPPGALGSEISEVIDINALAELSAPNALFTHSANTSRKLGEAVAIFNVTALQKGITKTVTFSLLDVDNYETEGALMMDVLGAFTRLQTGGVAVVELSYFQLMSSPLRSKLPSGPESMVQWEQDDIGELLRTVHAAVKQYFSYVA